MEHVHCIRTDSFPDLCHLTSSSCTRLQVLDLTAQRSEGAWPELQRLSLGLGSYLNAGVVGSFSGKWPLLQAFSASRLDQAAMSELVAIGWPLLRNLTVEFPNDAMPDLMNGRWPQLRQLSISCLDDSGLKHLRHCPWSTLERLQLSHCNMTAISATCLIQAYLPNLQELSLINFPFDAETQDGYLCFAQLAQGKWPCLANLSYIVLILPSIALGY